LYGKIRKLFGKIINWINAPNCCERIIIMAKCENCGKTTTFGHNRSFSMRATNRSFKPNLQKISVYENGKKVKKLFCAKCIRTLAKSK